jgi:hypothetical protein
MLLAAGCKPSSNPGAGSPHDAANSAADASDTAADSAPIPSDVASAPVDAAESDRYPDTPARDATQPDAAADRPPLVCGPNTALPRFKAYKIGSTGEPMDLERRPYLGMVASSPRLLVTTYPTIHLLEPDTLSDLEASWKDTALKTSPGTFGREGLGLVTGSGGAVSALCWDLVGSDIKRLFSVEWGGHTGDPAVVEPLNASAQSLYAAFIGDAQGRAHAVYLASDDTARHGQRDPGGWVHETAGPAVGRLNGFAIAAAPDGRVAIAHASLDLSVMVRTAGVWSVERVAVGQTPLSPGLVFDQQGALHVMWVDRGRGVRWSVRDPGGWRTPADLTPNWQAQSNYRGRQLSIALAADGRIHAVASLDQSLQYLRYDGCQWSWGQVEVPKTPGRPPELELPSNFARSPSLALDDAGRPHLAAVYFPNALSSANAVYYYLRPLDAPPP